MSRSLVVIGTGLIGGSFAVAARRHGVFDEIIGIDANRGHATNALKAGLVDRLLDPDQPLPADAGVLIAVQPSAIADWVVRLEAHPLPVTDVGSTKGAVIDAVRERLGRLPPRYVPGHPIAGSEASGPGAARDELFAGKSLVLTPEPETSDAALAEVRRWWSDIGARVIVMSSAEHDRRLAFTSHLPHLVAFALMQGLDDHHFDFIGGGFRDFTRIAGSDPALWQDIFRSNRVALLEALDGFERILEDARRCLEEDDATALEAMIEQASRTRRRLDRSG